MTKVVLSGKCGNSPKNALAESTAVAILTNDRAGMSALDEACAAHLPDGVETIGIEALAEAMASRVGRPDALTIRHAITHGKTGAVNGKWMKENIEQDFALFFTFRTAKADSIVTARLYLG